MASTDVASFIGQLSDIGIPFKTPTDPDWATYSSTYNLRLPVTPAVVVVPSTVEHISNAITFAGKHGFKVQARSGGHSYASYSNGGVDGSIVIDLRKIHFRTISASDDPNCVIVGSGTRLGELAQTIDQRTGWKRALPHGTCASVGVGGHFTHGGYGFFSRAWGLAMDRIAKIMVVLANGQLVLADENQNQDLFYVSPNALIAFSPLTSELLLTLGLPNKAMRGAADSFGIAVAFYLNTVPTPESIIHWDFKVSDATKSIESAVRAFQHIQTFVHDHSVVDRQLGLNVTLSSDYFAVGGTFLGSRNDFVRKVIPALLEGIPEFPTIEVKQVDWATSLKLLNQGRELDSPTDSSEHSNFFAKSVTIPEPGFTAESLTDFFTYLLDQGARAPISYFILADLYGGADSQINAKDQSFSAFAHRDTLWVTQLYGYVDNEQVFPSEGLDFINGLASAMTARLPSYGAYSNYTDPSLPREEANDLYYGKELHKKLKQLKRDLDPNNVFANPQSIEG
ncbi:putative glucooligosaccharide oxidase [Daldinia vernicosa]|uniref:putative glucooligosaccharide oxidase n=1 Tax=Daldinia vernicosa TaxID=114800 RepID=UPI00200796D3|nr:putative glucooligosaccharide oxidase [Daldinia vernicosa]KAI0844891.1 putative glucooligosaccharide oxidase [Daldinia vernicosa]